MSIRIMTDSTSDISQELAEQLHLIVVPLKVVFTEGAYRDGIDMKPEDFYTKLIHAEKLPTTSQPTPNEFLPYFEEAKRSGDDVIVILISSRLSGTYQSASIAKDTCGYNNIYIIDSLQGSISLRILVELALSLREQGKSTPEILQILEKEKGRIHLHIAVNTLEYLKKGGRLSKTAAFAGSLLGIKPIIGLKDGIVEMQGKGRGFQKAFQEVLALIESNGGADLTMPVCFGYTGEKESLALFKNKMQKQFPGIEPGISIMGSVIGTHVGPGACAIAYFAKE